MNKTIISLLCAVGILLTSYTSSAQSFNQDKTELANFLTRMYNSAPFEGVKVITDYDNAYLLSVLTLDKSKYTNQTALNRVAEVKAMSQASRFFNGSSISTEMIIRTTEKTNGTFDAEMIETIRENSIGYVKALEQLTNFEGKDSRQVFMYFKKIDLSSR